KILIQIGAKYVVERTVGLLKNAVDDSTTSESVLVNSEDMILRNPEFGLDIAVTLAKTPPAQQIYYATALSKATVGWTPPLYEQYFRWFYDAFGYSGGFSYVGYVNAARRLAL